MELVHDHMYFDKNMSNRETISAQNAHALLVLNNMTDILDLMKMMDALETKEEYEQFDKAVYNATETYLEQVLPELISGTDINKQQCLALLKA